MLQTCGSPTETLATQATPQKMCKVGFVLIYCTFCLQFFDFTMEIPITDLCSLANENSCLAVTGAMRKACLNFGFFDGSKAKRSS